MKKVLGGLAAVLLLLAFSLPVMAGQPTSPPGQDECDRGNSTATCRPDPQPSHGADCDEHGPKDGGVNEDHCLPSPTPTSTPTSTPSPSPSASPTSTPTPSEEPTPTPTVSPSPTVAPTPSFTSTPSSTPNVTPPPTDTEAAATTGVSTPPVWLLIPLAVIAFAIGYTLTGRKVR